MAVLAVVFLMLTSTPTNAAEIVDVYQERCQHGLHQPKEGDFAVYVFCDDASGTQLGIIYTKPGIGPVESGTDWSNGNRFWQDGEWVYDARQIAWSPSGNFLYVTTSGIIGLNGFYELDLRNRTATKLLGDDRYETEMDMEINEGDTLVVNGKSFKIKD